MAATAATACWRRHHPAEPTRGASATHRPAGHQRAGGHHRPAAPESKYSEAPDLAAKVAAGELPPVDERLPLEPLVLTPVFEVGKYGGVWRQLHMGTTDAFQNYYKTYEFAGKFNPDGIIEPNVAKSWEFSEDGTSVTIFLREGMKWSDGAPFTTADVSFWWNDIVLNDELTPAKPAALKRMANWHPRDP